MIVISYITKTGRPAEHTYAGFSEVRQALAAELEAERVSKDAAPTHFGAVDFNRARHISALRSVLA